MRAACRAMGIHPSTYYRWRRQVLRFGPEILRPREPLRPKVANQTSPYARQTGWDRALPQRGAPGSSPAWPFHPGQAPRPDRGLRRAPGTGAPSGAAGTAPGRVPTWRDGPDGLLLIGRLRGAKGAVWRYTAIDVGAPTAGPSCTSPRGTLRLGGVRPGRGSAGARHLFIRAGRPQTKGCVERVQQSILEEC